MKRTGWLVALGVAIFLTGLVTMLPARVAVAWFVPEDVRMAGISGTAWQGRAARLDAGGVFLSNVTWRIRPLPLLTGRIAGSLSAEPAGGLLETDLSLSPSGRLALSGLRAAVPFSSIAAGVNLNGARGNVTANLDRAVVENGLPVSANGSVEVAGLVIPDVHPGPLGRFRLEINDADNGIVASLEDVNAVIDLAGSLRLNRDASYAIVAQIAATAETPGDLRDSLSRLPRGNSDETREIRLEGSL